MQRFKCQAEMMIEKLMGDSYGMAVYVSNKKKGILEVAKHSTVSSHVCPKCGHIELNADDPKQLV